MIKKERYYERESLCVFAPDASPLSWLALAALGHITGAYPTPLTLRPNSSLFARNFSLRFAHSDHALQLSLTLRTPTAVKREIPGNFSKFSLGIIVGFPIDKN
ncbi:MAG: hypothetical protein DRO92_01235 [Candidatus Altiarchaeales archaeon]|nr:MAG: hypothetical protein DRO92_01235 [Candidatus Altiarchaeales archaeon]